MTWKEIFYKILAFTKVFHCKECNQSVSGAYLKHCKFHPSKALFSFGSNIGFYACCKQKTQRFNSTHNNNGCLVRSHIPSTPEQEEAAELLLSNLREPLTQEPLEAMTCNLPIDGEYGDLIKTAQELTKYKSLIEILKQYQEKNQP